MATDEYMESIGRLIWSDVLAGWLADLDYLCGPDRLTPVGTGTWSSAPLQVGFDYGTNLLREVLRHGVAILDVDGPSGPVELQGGRVPRRNARRSRATSGAASTSLRRPRFDPL